MAPNKPTLAQTAQQNPTQLGDPVSLKAETSDTKNTATDTTTTTTSTPQAGVKGRPKAEEKEKGNNEHKSLKDLAKENPTQLGDPVSLKAETSRTEPTDQDRGAAGMGKTGGSKL